MSSPICAFRLPLDEKKTLKALVRATEAPNHGLLLRDIIRALGDNEQKAGKTLLALSRANGSASPGAFLGELLAVFDSSERTIDLEAVNGFMTRLVERTGGQLAISLTQPPVPSPTNPPPVVR